MQIRSALSSCHSISFPLITLLQQRSESEILKIKVIDIVMYMLRNSFCLGVCVCVFVVEIDSIHKFKCSTHPPNGVDIKAPYASLVLCYGLAWPDCAFFVFILCRQPSPSLVDTTHSPRLCFDWHIGVECVGSVLAKKGKKLFLLRINAAKMCCAVVWFRSYRDCARL